MSDRKPKLRAAVIIDDNKLYKWQQNALDACSDILEVQIYLNCTNSSLPIKLFKHFMYYGLNLVAMRPPQRRKVAIDPTGAKVVNFACSRERGWETIPAEVAAEVNIDAPDVVIKFGMGLLRDPDQFSAPYGVLSFHHGDPTCYRGRPAGFYEMLDDSPRLGFGIQRINNSLDGGHFLEIRHVRILPHSYNRTLSNVYGASPDLFRKVMQAISVGESKAYSIDLGKIYRLPSNAKVFQFLIRLGFRKARRLINGAFFEKKWDVATTDSDGLLAAIEAGQPEFRIGQGRVLPNRGSYGFQADPFFAPNGESLYIEALCKRTGLGEIVNVDITTGEKRGAALSGGHLSYPSIVESSERCWVLPEAASWSAPQFHELDADGLLSGHVIPLKGLENQRLLDPTYFQKNLHHYVFAGKPGSSEHALLLFVSENFDGPYRPHPKNPVVMDPSCARMGGAIVSHEGRTFRVGQNNSYGYGDGAVICEIFDLTPTTYREKRIVSVTAGDGGCGPHTINIKGKRMVFDFYRNQFSVGAGYRRLLALVAKTKVGK
jgi:hypothetical protein